MFTSHLATALLAVGAIAAPVKRQSTTAITDPIILNFALTLEQLENAFYTGALAKFDAEAFAAAGFAPLVRGRYEQISQHEATHVAFLTSILGTEATQACNYSFPYTDVKSFVALSQTFEAVGTSAYLGAAPFLSSKELLTGSAAILTTEARQQAWISASVESTTPWSGSFDTPLDFNQAFTLASGFITSCPSTNPTLPFKAFPALNVTSAVPSLAPGATLTLEFASSNITTQLFLSLLTGLDTISVEITDNTVTLPSNVTGTVYAVVSSNSTSVTDATTIAGPIVLQFDDPVPSS